VNQKKKIFFAPPQPLCQLNQNNNLPLVFCAWGQLTHANEKKKTLFGPPQPSLQTEPKTKVHVLSMCHNVALPFTLKSIILLRQKEEL
jgi:hypothetical protein